MIHRIMTCKNHPNLRWNAKDIAVGGEKPGDPAMYNGSRHIFFDGTPSGDGMYFDGSGLKTTRVDANGNYVTECNCSSDDLIIAPEDALVRREGVA